MFYGVKGGGRGEKREGDKSYEMKKDGNGIRYERNNSPSNFSRRFALV
jgi:hypothetical protein